MIFSEKSKTGKSMLVACSKSGILPMKVIDCGHGDFTTIEYDVAKKALGDNSSRQKILIKDAPVCGNVQLRLSLSLSKYIEIKC